MNKLDISNCLKVAACICGKDGLISETEEQKMFELAVAKLPSFTLIDFDSALDDFFQSEEQLEDYLDKIKDHDIRKFTLKLSEVSASVDGLNIKENIALQKAYLIWGGSYE